MCQKRIRILLKSRYKRMSFWSFSQSEKKESSPTKSTRKKTPIGDQRTSFCTSYKASYSVEAAIVVPILAFFLATILFFFQVLRIQCRMDEALLYAGRETAVESSVVLDKDTIFLAAEACLFQALEADGVTEKDIKGGVFGIRLRESIDEKWIFLEATYDVELPIALFGIDAIELKSQNRFRRWNQISYAKENKSIVYVTLNGNCYHSTLECRVLRRSIKEASIEAIADIRGANGQKYKECSSCDWENGNKDFVYYTPYGELYHKSLSCGYIKRTIDTITMEDIGERSPCSFCYSSKKNSY